MQITYIQIAAFGKLKNYTLHLTDGFNLIYGENEYGKSTIMAFLYMIFYGKPAGSKGRDIQKNMRSRYAPWDGSKMSGTIEFKIDKDVYRIEKTWGKSEKSDKSAIYKNGSESIVLQPGEEIGAHFLGMDAQAFENSIYIGNGSVFSGNGNDSITEKISNLSGSGDEAISSEKVMKKLLAEKEEIISKSGRAGELVKLRQEIQQLQEECQRIQSVAEEQKTVQEQYQQVQEQQQSCMEERDRLERQIRFQELEELIELEHAYKAIMQKLERYGEQEKLEQFIRENEWLAAQAGQELQQEPDRVLSEEILAQGHELEEAWKLANQKKNQTEEDLQPGNQPRGSRAFLYGGLLLLVVGIVSGLFLHPLCWILAAASVIPIFLYVRGKAQRTLEEKTEYEAAEQEAEAAQEALSQFLKHYQVTTLDGLQKLYLSQESDRAITEKWNMKIRQARQALAHHFKKQEEDYMEAVLQLNNIKQMREERVQLQHSVAAKKQAYGYEGVSLEEMIDRQIACGGETEQENVDIESLKKRWQQLEQELVYLTECQRRLAQQMQVVDQNPETLQQEINQKQELAGELEHQYQVTDLAYRVMEDTMNEIRQSFGPELNRRTSEILSRLTGGIHREAMVHKDYKVQLVSGEDRHFREYGYFSAGTMEQIYLALRLAMTELVGAGETALPLFLDDILAQYDDERAADAAAYLRDYRGQVIMFTCHSHIKRLIEGQME